MTSKLALTCFKLLSTLLQTKIAIWEGKSRIAISVFSNLALQICKLATNLTGQECKLQTSLSKRLSHHASNSLQTVAKTEHEHNFGFEPETARFLNLSS
ncbi:hypothetical protein AVEN_222294-1 [Araneus ventricosus]|uniref:DUF4371 domain-containing protein n=1 Tax=Araneus ventricosus TaxID=182803 RepID=A0A4Y2NG54_ARAVE|nr:hypothetical protein AVEN_222294-1 [Araneus ventricosus]